MVRVFLKGGVWKNSEDEILKAAVQKYGKQQWARVASLLNRKTAKQAKARWYEWLDPSIRKTEWSTSEEEQLLQLAKLLPAQWKTIAAAIGRTAIQCQEHYEELLDQAAVDSGNADSGAATTTALRAGQIDSHPESKPARPDPVDMDEDEMEMLQEARARLANTQGKKAKRKQRERTLEAAKRLADLQKRRELKQAGLLAKRAVTKSKKSKREIDYGVEIPFYKPPAVGFHNVLSENIRTEQIRSNRLRQIDYGAINEQQYRSRDKEAAQIRKREEHRMKILQQTNDKYAAAANGSTLSAKEKREQDIEDDGIRSALKNRIGPLDLPEPTITDGELHRIAKLQASVRNKNMDDDDTNFFDEYDEHMDYYDDARSILTKAVSAKTGTATTATAASRREAIVAEATRLRKLGQRQTPLLMHTGEEDEVIDDEVDKLNDDDGGDVDNKYELNDDNESLMDRKPAARLSSSGSLSISKRSKKRNRNYEDDDTASIGASTLATSATDTGTIVHVQSIRELALMQKRAAQRIRDEINRALATLPQPQYEYELAIPETATTTETIQDHDDDDADEYGNTNNILSSIGPTDRADIEAEEKRQLELQAKKLYEQRNSVIKRKGELPRLHVSSFLREHGQQNNLDNLNATAQQLIEKKMIMLIQHDAIEFTLSDDDEQDDFDDIEAADDEHTNNDDSSRKPSKKKKNKKNKKRKKRKLAKVSSLHALGSVELETFTEMQLDNARQLLLNEVTALIDEKATSILDRQLVHTRSDALDLLYSENRANYSHYEGPYIFSNESMTWIQRSTCTDEQIRSYMQYEISLLRKATMSLRKKNDKITNKVNKMTGGYTKIAHQCKESIGQLYGKLQDNVINMNIYQQLEEQEKLGSANRIQELKDLISTVTRRHLELQKEYGQLLVEQKRRRLQVQ